MAKSQTKTQSTSNVPEPDDAEIREELNAAELEDLPTQLETELDPEDLQDPVDELADSGQAYEASVLEGIEDAADHPERPVHVRSEDKPPTLPEEDAVISSVEIPGQDDEEPGPQ